VSNLSGTLPLPLGGVCTASCRSQRVFFSYQSRLTCISSISFALWASSLAASSSFSVFSRSSASFFFCSASARATSSLCCCSCRCFSSSAFFSFSCKMFVMIQPHATQSFKSFSPCSCSQLEQGGGGCCSVKTHHQTCRSGN